MILVLFTVPLYHFLFLRYLVLAERHFSSDILVPFPDSSNLYSCAYVPTFKYNQEPSTMLPHYSPTFPTLPPHYRHTPFPSCQLTAFPTCPLSELTALPPFPAHHPPNDKQVTPKQQRSSTRQTGQIRVTNSWAAIHESWLLRCSLRTSGFSRSNQDDLSSPIVIIMAIVICLHI